MRLYIKFDPKISRLAWICGIFLALSACKEEKKPTSESSPSTQSDHVSSNNNETDLGHDDEKSKGFSESQSDLNTPTETKESSEEKDLKEPNVQENKAVKLPAPKEGSDIVIISRSAWQAKSPKPDISKYSDYNLEVPKYTDVILHVTAMGAGTGIEEVQRIQNYQMEQSKFSDIGYNFLIDSDGIIYEGRSLNHIPSHAGQSLEANTEKDIIKDPDYGAIGISFSAASDEGVTDAQLESGEKLIRYLIAQHQISELYTHAEVKKRLEEKSLTPVGKFNPKVCTGEGSLEDIIDLRKKFKFSFDEGQFRALFDDY